MKKRAKSPTMSDALKGNQNAVKPADAKLTGKGRLTADLGEELRDRLDKAAKKAGISRIKMLRQLLDEHLPK